MIIDEVQIHVKAGHGGVGKVAFDTSKGGRGATGGSGGRGGGVYLEGVSDLSALKRFRHQKSFVAEKGGDGKAKTLDGRTGEDLVLRVPVGTVIKNTANNDTLEILKVGERVKVAEGGIGGRGNFQFRGPTNTSPKQFDIGRPGEEKDLFLELRLIADIGLVGLPNAGKSSLLNELTRANVKVANYPFTTLEPNLGAFYGKNGVMILADIPGLIEGASAGKGLGIKFLRHIRRTEAILHCVAADAEDAIRDYETIREELGAYNKDLLERPEYLCITKTDLATSEKLEKIKNDFKKKGIAVSVVVSIYDPEAMAELTKFLGALVISK